MSKRIVVAGWEFLYIPLLSSPVGRILPLKNLAFVSTPLSQNPPDLLPPKSVCQLPPAYIADAATSPFPAVSTQYKVL